MFYIKRYFKRFLIIFFIFLVCYTFWRLCRSIINSIDYENVEDTDVLGNPYNSYLRQSDGFQPFMLSEFARDHTHESNLEKYGETIDLNEVHQDHGAKYSLFHPISDLLIQPQSASKLNKSSVFPTPGSSSSEGGIRPAMMKEMSKADLHPEFLLARKKKIQQLRVLAEEFKVKCRKDIRGVNSNIFHHIKFSIAETTLCDVDDVRLLLFVQSKTSNFDRRMRIRSTFGSLNQINGKSVRLFFSLGKSLDKDVESKIVAESRAYRDIIQGNFQEHIRNMSLNQNMAFRWIINFCSNAQFVIKLDDDTFVDVVHLNYFLNYVPERDLLYCSVARNRRPIRQQSSKWYVSRRIFAHNKFPPYCLGLGYVMSIDMTAKLLGCSMSVRNVPVDDAFYTGIVADQAKLSHHDFWKGHSYTWLTPHSVTPMLMADFIFFVSKNNIVEDSLWRKLWRSALLNG